MHWVSPLAHSMHFSRCGGDRLCFGKKGESPGLRRIMASAGVPPPPPDFGEPIIMRMLTAFFISCYITGCFLVAEIMMVAHGPQGKRRDVIEALAHIASGPIAFLSFFQGDFVGTMLFFLAIWHFLSDTGNARPSYVFLCPCRKRGGLDFWLWFESLWLLIHHTFIGTFKLSVEMGLVSTTGGGVQIERALHFWIAGATMSHLAIGMDMFSVRCCTNYDFHLVRVTSVVLRMGVEWVAATTEPHIESCTNRESQARARTLVMPPKHAYSCLLTAPSADRLRPSHKLSDISALPRPPHQMHDSLLVPLVLAPPPSALGVAMLWDLFWMSVMLSLVVRKALCARLCCAPATSLTNGGDIDGIASEYAGASVDEEVDAWLPDSASLAERLVARASGYHAPHEARDRISTSFFDDDAHSHAAAHGGIANDARNASQSTPRMKATSCSPAREGAGPTSAAPECGATSTATSAADAAKPSKKPLSAAASRLQQHNERVLAQQRKKRVLDEALVQMTSKVLYTQPHQCRHQPLDLASASRAMGRVEQWKTRTGTGGAGTRVEFGAADASEA